MPHTHVQEAQLACARAAQHLGQQQCLHVLHQEVELQQRVHAAAALRAAAAWGLKASQQQQQRQPAADGL
jgi:hypothetical protein